MEKQPVYELRPLLKVFTDAGATWISDARVGAELKRQGLEVMEADGEYITLGAIGDVYESISFFSNRSGHKVVTATYPIDEEIEASIRYSYNSDGQDGVRFTSFEEFSSGLLPYYDALGYAQKLVTAIEAIQLIQKEGAK